MADQEPLGDELMDRWSRVWSRWDARAAARAARARALADATVVELPEPPATVPGEAGAGEGEGA